MTQDYNITGNRISHTVIMTMINRLNKDSFDKDNNNDNDTGQYD